MPTNSTIRCSVFWPLKICKRSTFMTPMSSGFRILSRPLMGLSSTGSLLILKIDPKRMTLWKELVKYGQVGSHVKNYSKVQHSLSTTPYSETCSIVKTDQVQQSTFVLILLKKGSPRITLLCITGYCITYKELTTWFQIFTFQTLNPLIWTGRCMQASSVLMSGTLSEHLLFTKLWGKTLQSTAYQCLCIRIYMYIYVSCEACQQISYCIE